MNVVTFLLVHTHTLVVVAIVVGGTAFGDGCGKILPIIGSGCDVVTAADGGYVAVGVPSTPLRTGITKVDVSAVFVNGIGSFAVRRV